MQEFYDLFSNIYSFWVYEFEKLRMYSHEDVSLALLLAVDGITLNPKNTFEHQPHSTAFW